MEIRDVPFEALGGVFERDDVEAALSVLEAAARPGGNFFPLPEESDFQQAFAEHEGTPHAIAVNSCGTALDVCMMALEIGPGDEVIVPGQTFVCTATCAAARGAGIVFADVDPRTMCLDPKAVEAKITPRTRAIIPVHFAGHPCDVEAFDSLSRTHAIPVIYDAAHAVSTRWRDEPIGKWGLASCYSFQSNKNMTTLGEGGAVVTGDPDFAEKVRQLKTFGYVYGSPLRVASIGFNYRMTKAQAAVGLTQLRKIDRIVAQRLERFRRLNTLLDGLEGVDGPTGIAQGHACHIYVIQVHAAQGGDRDAFRKHLLDTYRVGCALHYPAVWTWDASRCFSFDNSHCPNTERICASVLTLPVFPNTTDEDLQYIAWAVRETASHMQRAGG